MSVKFYVETPWDTSPDNTSTYEVYAPDDFFILGNGVDDLQKYDTNQWERLEGSPPKGNLFQVYKNRLMVAGDPSFPHRIWFSHIRNAEGWSKDTDWLDVYPEDGGKVNGMGIQNDELIISKDNGRLYGWRIYDDGTPEKSKVRIIEDDRGQVGRFAGVTSRDVRYYIARKFMETYPATKKGGLSYVIQEVFDAIDDSTLDDIATGAKNDKVYASVGNLTFTAGTSISFSNVVVVYDTVNDAFYLRDQMDAQVFTRFIDSSTGVEDLYYGDSSGQVNKIDSGTTAARNPITMVVRTKNFFEDLERNVIVKKIGVVMDQPGGTEVAIRTHPEEDYRQSLGEVTETPVHWFDTPGQEVPFISLQFTHSGSNARPVLKGWILVYREAGRDEPSDGR